MTTGLYLCNASGQPIMDVNTYTGQVLTSITTNSAQTGTYTNAALIGKHMLPIVADTGVNGSFGGPNLSFNPSTGTVSWTYSWSANGKAAPSYPNDTILLGFY